MSPHSPLHQELDRLADTQPAFRPDPALWDRGRRARLRTRVVAGAVALAVVAIVGGVGATTRAPDDAPTADRPAGRGAVPAQLHAAPEHLTHFDEGGTRWDDELGTDDLAIGRAAVAFLSGGPYRRLPVLVDADDGTHHLVDLPGWVGNDSLGGVLSLGDGPGLSLSPDGRRLAWAYGRPAAGREDYAPVDSGIRIADLTTGEVRDVDLRPLLTTGQALVTHSLVWSPDGSTLGWRGMEMRQFNASGRGSNLPFQLGLVEVATGRARSVAIPGVGRAGSLAIAATDAGELVAVQPGGLVQVWRSGQVRKMGRVGAQLAVTPVAAAGADGREIVLGSPTPVSSVPFLDLDDGAVVQRRIGAEVYNGGVRVQPLGWVDATHVAALVTSDDPAHAGTSQLVVMTSDSVPEELSSWRIAGRWEVPLDGGVSVAVDLVPELDGTSNQKLTRDFPAPEWAASPWRERLPYVLGGLLALLAGLAYIRMLRHQA